MRPIIGITGGIGAGKSVVSRILRLKGFEVFDCDYEAKAIMDADIHILSSLKERYGDAVIADKTTINRKNLAKIVFADRAELDWLNGLVHSAVREAISDLAEESEPDDSPLFVESAIMVTSGLDRLCKEIWVVDAEPEVRIARAVAREGSSPEAITDRMRHQLNEFDFAPERIVKRIDNSGTEGLLVQVDYFLSTMA